MPGATESDSEPETDRTVLLTGATGYLGALAAAAIATDQSARLILLTRARHDPKLLAARIVAEADLLEVPRVSRRPDRIIVLPQQGVWTPDALFHSVREFQISEIIHCAGSLSYWNTEKLEAGNVQLTETLLETGRRVGLRRFTYLSSAFCSGYMDHAVTETLHRLPGLDPTPYTASKRAAEMRVAASGLPWLILRPSIVIGDSRDGRYEGKLSGFYQFLWAIQRYLVGLRSVIRVTAPEIPLQVVHQDAFQAAFLSAYRFMPDNSIVHVVSSENGLPTVRQMWDAIIGTYLPDREYEYYDRYCDIPLDKCEGAMRQFLQAVRTNAEISAHRWTFESKSMPFLREMGLGLSRTSVGSVRRCLDCFFAGSGSASRRRRESTICFSGQTCYS